MSKLVIKINKIDDDRHCEYSKGDLEGHVFELCRVNFRDGGVSSVGFYMNDDIWNNDMILLYSNESEFEIYED